MRLKKALQLRILALCRERRLSLNALSSRCGLRQSTLNNIISGRNNSVTIQTVARICKGLDISLHTFFDTDLFRNLEQEIC